MAFHCTAVITAHAIGLSSVGRIGAQYQDKLLPCLQVVLVVPRELRMSPGKLAAQCAHAAVGLYKLMLANRVPWLASWEVRSTGSIWASEVSAGTLRFRMRCSG